LISFLNVEINVRNRNTAKLILYSSVGKREVPAANIRRKKAGTLYPTN